MTDNLNLSGLVSTSPSFRAPIHQTRNINLSEDILKRIEDKLQPMLYQTYISCDILRLSTETRFSAMVFVHRYMIAVETNKPENSAKQSETSREASDDKAGSRWIWAACLFLACKAEEEPRRLRDVINLAHMLSSSSSSSSSSKDIHNNIISIADSPPALDNHYWDSKKVIVAAEQSVLRWLGFDTTVIHPHRAAKILLEGCSTNTSTERLQAIAFRRLNDALFYTPALTHSALELACAAIHLALGEVERVEGREAVRVHGWGQDWWGKFGISNDGIERTKEDLEKATEYLRSVAD